MWIVFLYLFFLLPFPVLAFFSQHTSSCRKIYRKNFIQETYNIITLLTHVEKSRTNKIHKVLLTTCIFCWIDIDGAIIKSCSANAQAQARIAFCSSSVNTLIFLLTIQVLLWEVIFAFHFDVLIEHLHFLLLFCQGIF